MKLLIANTRFYSLFLLLPLLFIQDSLYARYTPEATRIYNFFKSQMNGLPQTKPIDTLMVGTFDQATGEMTGIGSETVEIPNRHGGTSTHGRILYSKGKLTILRFNLISNAYTVLVFNNVQYDNHGMKFIEVRLDKLVPNDLTFKLMSGAKSFSNKFTVRPFLINAIGAYTLAELPLGIIYVPPGIISDENYALYFTTEIFKTILSTTTTNSTEITKSSMDLVGNVVSLGIKAAAALEGTYGAALGAGLAALPTENITQTIGESITEGLEISYSAISSETIKTSRGIQDEGNIYVYIANVRFIFSILNNEITISLLDFEDYHILTKNDLQESDPDRYSRIKILDPFTSSSGPDLASNNRYVQYSHSPVELSDSVPFKVNLGEITSNSTVFSQVNYSTKIVDHDAGWLAPMFGADESYSKTISLSESRSNQISHTNTYNSEVSLCANDGPHNYIIYLDKLFKTIIVIDQTDGLSRVPIISGSLKDAKTKNPIANMLIYITKGGKRFITKTDFSGKYNYYDKELEGYKGTPQILNRGVKETRVPTIHKSISNH